MRKDIEINHHSLLIVVKDATIPTASVFPVSMIDNILPFLPHCNLFIFFTTINLCQKCLTHELVVKAAVNYSTKSKQSMPIMSKQSIHLIQYPLYVLSTEQFMFFSNEIFAFNKWTSMYVLFDVSTGFTGQPVLNIFDMNQKFIL